MRRRPTPGSVRSKVACHLFIHLQRQRRWTGRRPQQLRQMAGRAACRRNRGGRCKLHGQPGCRMRRASKAQSVGSFSRRLAAPLDPLSLPLSLSHQCARELLLLQLSQPSRPCLLHVPPQIFASLSYLFLCAPVVTSLRLLVEIHVQTVAVCEEARAGLQMARAQSSHVHEIYSELMCKYLSCEELCRNLEIRRSSLDVRCACCLPCSPTECFTAPLLVCLTSPLFLVWCLQAHTQA